MEVLVPVMIMVMPVIERPVSDATGAAPLDAGPLSREVRTSIICSLMPAFDPGCVKTPTSNLRVESLSPLR